MSKLIFILLAFLILGCNPNHKEKTLLGTWDFVSSTNLETGEVDFPEDDEDFVEFRIDSIFVSPTSMYAWKIKGDSIILEGIPKFFDSGFYSIPFYIKELTSNKLTVDFDEGAGSIGRFILKKRK